ncbi:MAG TPA: carboxymuconolactone decarboxylase family protein [Bryobacteraceae bacterium]|nr:carboxymuconolactone decarboxylase family protein [Bryobacteraceae bacterium]
MFNKFMFRKFMPVFFGSLALVSLARAQERLPMIPDDKLTDAQKKAVAGMQGGAFGVGGPFVALLREPKLAEQAVAMATYFRNESVLGIKLTELVILLAARNWTQQFEWTAHYSRALKAGLKQETVDAIAAGRRPAAMPEDEETVYDFWAELDHNKSVSDATYDRAVKKFGEQGVVSITALNGYYAMLAMVLNVARTPILPANAQVPQLPALPR